VRGASSGDLRVAGELNEDRFDANIRIIGVDLRVSGDAELARVIETPTGDVPILEHRAAAMIARREVPCSLTERDLDGLPRCGARFARLAERAIARAEHASILEQPTEVLLAERDRSDLSREGHLDGGCKRVAVCAREALAGIIISTHHDPVLTQGAKAVSSSPDKRRHDATEWRRLHRLLRAELVCGRVREGRRAALERGVLFIERHAERAILTGSPTPHLTSIIEGAIIRLGARDGDRCPARHIDLMDSVAVKVLTALRKERILAPTRDLSCL
jgi:hypothetical protein